jgi:hypothetical protein
MPGNSIHLCIILESATAAEIEANSFGRAVASGQRNRVALFTAHITIQ